MQKFVSQMKEQMAAKEVPAPEAEHVHGESWLAKMRSHRCLRQPKNWPKSAKVDFHSAALAEIGGLSMSVMASVRKVVRWVAGGARRFQRPQAPKPIASQVFASGARMTLFTRGQHSFLYSNGDFVRFGLNDEVLEIKSHDGTKWSKKKEKANA